MSNSHKQVDVRLPISLDILQSMIMALDMVAASPYDVALYTAVLSTGFFGLLCPGEMVYSEHALTPTNIYISPTNVVCFLPLRCTKGQYHSQNIYTNNPIEHA